MRVLIAVTHLLGSGHLARAALLGRGLAAAGHEVCLASGGRPVPNIDTSGVEFVQLPPVHCRGADFRTLWGEGDLLLDDVLRGKRRDALLAAFRRLRPDVVVTETYPFGRRTLALEFDALVEAVWKRADRPALLASVRDILAPPSSPQKGARTEAMIVERYDGVLVHGDRDTIALEASWPASGRLLSHLHYTGYVTDAALPDEVERGDEIIVSGGGGIAGLPLFAAALEASERRENSATWRVLVGHGVPEPEFERLAARAHPRLIVERARRDFRRLLAGAAVSVSQSGYNTVLDLAATHTPAVLVPFEEGGETEQRTRAQALAAGGHAVLLPAQDLSAEQLLLAVDRARHELRPLDQSTATDGVTRSVALIEAAGEKARRVASAWRALEARLDALHDAGRPARIWWRDDDAAEPTPALERLLDLRAELDVPIALAVSPRLATDTLAQRLAGEGASVCVLVHGVAHENHAPLGEKSRELGFRPATETLSALGDGLADLRESLGERVLPVLVPPWNRIDEELVPRLSALGYRGLSTFGARASRCRDGLAICNTHCDPIDWRRGGGLVDEETLLLRLVRDIEREEEIGILTHHRVHDERIWHVTKRLLRLFANHAGARIVDAAAIFPDPSPEQPRMAR
ncbi:glycosyltransferase [Aureimonas mangrovi]|uniref:glycosyltransferase n=1 Tax=Aureimonas mangrovi TaxID=2758041 RepID=UPI00163D4CB5|nr:glycosyltransferase [Aureimonas mangrovi]